MVASNQTSKALIISAVLFVVFCISTVVAFPSTHSTDKSAADEDMWPWFGPRPGRVLKRTVKDINAFNRIPSDMSPEIWQANPWVVAFLNAAEAAKLRKLGQDSAEGLSANNADARDSDGYPNMSRRSILFTPRLG